MRVGVEVGGTFTDLVVLDQGRISIAKVPSTPARPDEGALAAITAAGIDLARVDDLVHGSTVATNAILERKGAPVCFVVTRGFRDVLLLQRHNRRQIYNLAYAKPKSVVRRQDVVEIEERVAADGSVHLALDEQAAAEALRGVLGKGNIQSVAVCLLNSYANPAHELAVARIVREQFPDLTVTCSVDVTREFREFERASTTTLAAYVQPVIDRYLSRFAKSLAQRKFVGRLSIMQSNGGRMPVEGISRNAITSLFSGPAAGVIGSVRQARLSGFENLITFDMGGTSTDVCLVAAGKPDLAAETEVDGLPIRTPVLDIVTVGAGGGSLVWMDDGGLLRVGPESAGADPGPACYCRGGTRPTITDAHMIRGTVRPASFLGGKMTVDVGPAHKAVDELARHFKMSHEELADSAIRVAESNIVRAIQLVSTERGRDPRDYTLVPFGGAGPLHAARVAEELGIRSILVPPNAGVMSAAGLLAADYVHYETRTRRVLVNEAAPGVVRETFGEMAAAMAAYYRELGLGGDLHLEHALDMRYVGQAFEVTVPISSEMLEALTADVLFQSFDDAHHRVFEFGASPGSRAEIVSFRLGAAVPVEAMPAFRESALQARPQGEATIFDRGEILACKLVTRAAFDRVKPFAGPALVEDGTSTIYLPRGWQATIDEHENLIFKAM